MTITVPTSFEDISLEQYLKLSKVDPKDRLGQIAVLCDISRKEVKQMEKASLNEIEAMLVKMDEIDTEKFSFPKFIELEGRRYGMHPNLSEISVGEYVDLDELCKDPLENLPRIMSILYREVTEENFGIYEIRRYTGNEDPKPFLKMKMPEVLGVLNFFLTLGINFVTNSLPSLKEEMKEVI